VQLAPFAGLGKRLSVGNVGPRYPRMPRICDLKYALWLACSLAACSGELKGEVDGVKFARCAQTKPAARSYAVGALQLTVTERVLDVRGPSPLRVGAFTGPVGRAFTNDDMAQLDDDLAIWLGGLGDTAELASANLTRVAARRIPTVFIAGGADRLEIMEKAFEALPDDVPIVQGSGLRALRVGERHFLIAAGAPNGRYAIDEQGCGLTRGDLDSIEQAASGLHHPELLSWHAPNGESGGLGAIWRAIGEPHGLSAFPEARGPSDAWTVPRLGAPGTQRGDGARLKSRVGHFMLGADGLQARP
jgi:hypothetical protein